MIISSSTVVVEVPATLSIAVIFPGGAPPDARNAAQALAMEAAERLLHVSGAQLRAFNEINRIHPHGAGIVESVICQGPVSSRPALRA